MLISLQPLQAADLTWNGGVSGVWTNADGGWLDGGSPANWNNATPDAALFTGTTPTNVAVAANGVSVGNVTVSGTNYVFTGGNLTLSLANTTWSVDTGRSLTASNMLAGSGTLTKTGNGTLTTMGNGISNSMSVVVSAGTWAAGNGQIAFLTVDGGIVSSGGTVTATSYYLKSGEVQAKLGTGSIFVTGGTTKVGSSFNSASNAVSIQSGTLLLGNNNRIGTNASVNISGGTLDMSTFTNTIGSLVMSSGAVSGTGANKLTATTYTLSGGTVSANLGTGTMTVTNGSVALNGTTDAGTLSVSTGGTLTLGSANRIIDTSAVAIDGGTLAMSSFDDTVTSLAMSNNGAITGTGKLTAATYTLSGGTVSANLGAGTMTVTNGAVTLNGTADATTVNVNTDGTLTLGANDRIINTAALVVDGGTFDMGVNNETVSSVALKGAGTLQSSSTANVLVSSNTYDMQSGNVTARLGGATVDVGLNKTTTGTVTLSASNTYVGATAISEGVLRIAHNNALGTTQNDTTVFTGAALEMSGGITVSTDEALSLSGDGVSSGGALRNVSGDNTYGGAITMAAGSRINSDAGTLTIGGNIGGAGMSLSVGGAGNTVITRAIATSGGTFTKDGSGTVTLSGTNTYTGATEVTAGTLLINGNNSSATGAVSVGASATLGGSGTIGGATTVSGILAPGNSPAVLTFTNGLTLNSSAVTIMELFGTNTVAGTDFDQVKLTGGTLAYGGTLTITSWGGFDLLSKPASYDLFDFSSKSGSFTSVSVGALSLTFDSISTWTGNTNGTFYTFTENDGILAAAIPEPSTVALLALALGSLAFAGRKKIAAFRK